MNHGHHEELEPAPRRAAPAASLTPRPRRTAARAGFPADGRRAEAVGTAVKKTLAVRKKAKAKKGAAKRKARRRGEGRAEAKVKHGAGGKKKRRLRAKAARRRRRGDRVFDRGLRALAALATLVIATLAARPAAAGCDDRSRTPTSSSTSTCAARATGCAAVRRARGKAATEVPYHPVEFRCGDAEPWIATERATSAAITRASTRIRSRR